MKARRIVTTQRVVIVEMSPDEAMSLRNAIINVSFDEREPSLMMLWDVLGEAILEAS